MIKNVETYHEGDLWKVKVQGNDRASGTYATKEQAQAAGREKAKSLRVEHTWQRLVQAQERSLHQLLRQLASSSNRLEKLDGIRMNIWRQGLGIRLLVAEPVFLVFQKVSIPIRGCEGQLGSLGIL